MLATQVALQNLSDEIMIKIYKLVLTLVSLISLIGCSSELPISQLPSKMQLESYSPLGDLLTKSYVEAGDPIHTRLSQLLFQKNVKWKTSYVGYVMPPKLFRADNLIVRCFPDKFVVDVNFNNKMYSYERKHQNLLTDLGFHKGK